jgi:hypothetical protein
MVYDLKIKASWIANVTAKKECEDKKIIKGKLELPNVAEDVDDHEFECYIIIIYFI